MTKYKEIMDRVEVSEEMQSRVLKNVEVHFEKKRRKKRLALWAPVVGVLAAAAVLIILLKPWQGRREVSSTETESTTSTETPATNVITGGTEDSAPGAFFATDFTSLKELSDSIGFEVKEPVSFAEKIINVNYRNISKTIAEISFTGTKREINYRMTKEKGADNSGVYLDEDAKERKLTVDGCEVSLMSSEGKSILAIWTDGTYSYSLFCEQGFTEEEITSLVKDVLK